jgi:uncharacterized RDD family membrane protein YckC
MNADETYIDQVLAQLPRDARLCEQVGMELRSHIAERVEHGQTVEEALRQLGDPVVLAESYLAAIPLVAAPFWPRAAARLIDACGVLALIAVPIIAFVVLTLRREQGWFLLPIAFMVTIFVVSIIGALYPVIAEYRYGKTVGKHLMGLRVVRESGARISFGQSVVRQLPMLTQVWWIDMLFALFTDKHQRAFEMLSKTRVVVAREEQS